MRGIPTSPAWAMVSVLEGVPIGISSQLQPFVIEVTQADERIIRVRLKHKSRVAEYDPTETCETEGIMFYARFDLVLDQCPPRDTLNVAGCFNATTGSDNVGYELCVDPHGFGNRNANSSLLNVA